jgi:hypothetical protein
LTTAIFCARGSFQITAQFGGAHVLVSLLASAILAILFFVIALPTGGMCAVLADSSENKGGCAFIYVALGIQYLIGYMCGDLAIRTMLYLMPAGWLEMGSSDYMWGSYTTVGMLLTSIVGGGLGKDTK